MTDTEPTIIARMRPSAPRVLLGMAALIATAVFCAGVALVDEAPALTRAAMLAVAGGLGWLCLGMWRAGRGELILTEDALMDERGTVLARRDEIVRVDRGAFSFKPSNGFLLRTEKPGPRGMRPGLWWRIGRRIGVGGLVPAYRTKPVAEALEAELAGRML
ncbi:hypothetical protein [Litorisediminicola beolgyonensis]|uniref:DUF2244 domain-containing protein n=1 Tax=Litorisediminicola beolgyonensis TaxID=1173614 RepID=A0ABW3ZJA3_9RHOB